MEFLNDIIEKRMAAVKTDIVAGTFKSEEEFLVEINRLISVMTKTAVLKGIGKEIAQDYIQENFTSKIAEFYDQNTVSSIPTDVPVNYFFASIHEEIKTLIETGNFQEADEKINYILESLENEEYVAESIKDGVFTQDDVDYFKDIANPYFQELKDKTVVSKEPEKQGLLQRIKNGVKFVITGKNPYDNKTVKIKHEKQSFKEKISNSKISEWAKKHKVALTATGLAVVLAATGTFAAVKYLHNRAEQDSDNSNIEQEQPEEEIAMATFEVDENHNFNMNDQITHTEKLKLLARAMVERGVPVVSEEECMRLGNEGKLATSPEQLNNWFISMNLEDMDALTFTKLLKDSNTDKEELSSDFNRVNNILGAIYTTKEENAFIYEFISNKEYSEYIKAYEEAMIENQKGKSENLITLIKGRVFNPVASTSSGPLGMLSTSLIYQQANVYNVHVVGQDIMDLYNANYDCTTNTTSTFYSDDWAEYMRKLNSKLGATITFDNSVAYAQYLLTLTDEQNDNKVYIEKQVLPYLEENNIVLGEWDVLENIRDDDREVEIPDEGKKNDKGTVTDSASKEVKIIPKAPVTEEEKKVQEQVEAKLEKDNVQSFQNAVKDFALPQGGTVSKDNNGNFVILVKDENSIVVDTNTKGTYDASKDHQGPVYEEGQKGYEDYKKDHSDQVEDVDGVGNMVVEKEEIKTESNFYIDGKGNIIDKTTGKIVTIESEKELDKIFAEHPELKEWITKEEGKIHYSEVEDDLPQDSDMEESQQPQEPDNGLNGILTPEEQEELENMINGENPPEAGETLDEEYTDIVYGNYTVPELISNPALCKNIPEEILTQYPEIWSIYQDWLKEQNQAKGAQAAQTEENNIQEGANAQDIAAQIAALEEVKATLMENGVDNEQLSKELGKTLS